MEKLFLAIIAVLLSLSQAAKINYPASGQPCVLIELQADNMLEWTDKDGNNMTAPSFSFNDSFVMDGSCELPQPFALTRWQIDDKLFKFAFNQVNNKASVNMTLRFIPDNIFKNGEKGPVSLSMVMQLGSVDKAYTCDESMKYTNSAMAGNSKYKLKFDMKGIKIQGFNVKNGQFSEAEECDDAMTTDAKPTSAPTTKKNDQTTEKKPTDHTSHPTPKPTEPPTTKPTTKPTTEPLTTEPPTTKPTPKPTTEPPTTKPTPKPTTEPPTTKPTTKPPVTTEPPTVPPPTPSSHPSNTFKVFGNNNSVNCIYMKGEFLFSLPYPKKDNTTGNAPFGVQEIKSVTGQCNNTDNTNVLSVNFFKNWMMEITFATDKSKMLGDDNNKDFWWSKLDLTYTYDKDVFKDVDPKKENKTNTIKTTFTDHQFQGSMSSSYLCNSDTGVNLNSSAKLDTYHLQYNAFQTSKNQTDFQGEPSQCSADSATNKIVPIAVGAALAGLVVIVLIAYLIGRRRNRKGYESV